MTAYIYEFGRYEILRMINAVSWLPLALQRTAGLDFETDPVALMPESPGTARRARRDAVRCRWARSYSRVDTVDAADATVGLTARTLTHARLGPPRAHLDKRVTASLSSHTPRRANARGMHHACEVRPAPRRPGEERKLAGNTVLIVCEARPPRQRRSVITSSSSSSSPSLALQRWSATQHQAEYPARSAVKILTSERRSLLCVIARSFMNESVGIFSDQII